MDELKKENDTQKLENTKVNKSLETQKLEIATLTAFMNSFQATATNVTPETQTSQTQTEDIVISDT